MRRETRGVVLVFWIKSSLNLHHTTDKSTGWATTKAWCAWQSAHTASYPLTLAVTQPSSISSQAKSRRICAWCRCTRKRQDGWMPAQSSDHSGFQCLFFCKASSIWIVLHVWGCSIHIGAFSFARGFSWGWPWTMMKCCEQRAQYLLGHQISQHSDALHTYNELSWSTLSSWGAAKSRLPNHRRMHYDQLWCRRIHFKSIPTNPPPCSCPGSGSGSWEIAVYRARTEK